MKRARHSAIRGPDRMALHSAQRDVCAICGGRFARRDPATVDHVYPKTLCPWRGMGNVVLAHRSCNCRKGDRPPTGCEVVWLMFVNARLGARMPSVARTA